MRVLLPSLTNATAPSRVEDPTQPAFLCAFYVLTCVVIARACFQLARSSKALGRRRAASVFLLLGVPAFLGDAANHLKFFAPPGEAFELIGLVEYPNFVAVNLVLGAVALVGREVDAKCALAWVFVPFALILPIALQPNWLTAFGHELPSFFPSTHAAHAKGLGGEAFQFHASQLLVHAAWTIGFPLLSERLDDARCGRVKAA